MRVRGHGEFLMRGRWRYDEKTLTLIPLTDDRVPYRELTEAEKTMRRREDEQRERDAHPGNYS